MLGLMPFPEADLRSSSTSPVAAARECQGNTKGRFSAVQELAVRKTRTLAKNSKPAGRKQYILNIQLGPKNPLVVLDKPWEGI
jgi:hypothetical protein